MLNKAFIHEHHGLHQRITDQINDLCIELQDETLNIIKVGCSEIESKIQDGARIAFQDDMWFLFSKDGNGLASGVTLFQLIVDVWAGRGKL